MVYAAFNMYVKWIISQCSKGPTFVTLVEYNVADVHQSWPVMDQRKSCWVVIIKAKFHITSNYKVIILFNLYNLYAYQWLVKLLKTSMGRVFL